jgi:hypothetical protein
MKKPMDESDLLLQNLLLQNLLDPLPNHCVAPNKQEIIGLSTSDKTAFLLSALDFHIHEIQRREEKEQRIFDWCTNLLLITFGAIVALAGQAQSLAFPVFTKIVATIFIGFPTAIFVYRIMIQRTRTRRNAEIVQRIEEIFHVYEDEYYSREALYPKKWSGNLSKVVSRRKTPIYYSIIIVFLAICVIVTIWLLL